MIRPEEGGQATAATHAAVGVETPGAEIALSGPRTTKPPRYPELDGLRGLAAISVVVFHYMVGPARQLPFLERILQWLEMTPMSIDVFFVLSGFLIGGILLQMRDSEGYYRKFYLGRCTRIFPVYYAWLGVFAVLYFAAQGWGLRPPQGYSGALYLATYFCFFQNFFPGVIGSAYMLVATWTLVVEEYFYLLIPVCVRRLNSRRLAQLLVSVVILAPLFRGVLFRYIGHRSDWAVFATRYWPVCRADALVMGVLLAMAWGMPEQRAWMRRRGWLFPCGMVAFSGVALALGWMADNNVNYGRVLNVSLGRTAVEFACLCLLLWVICRPEGLFGRLLTSSVMRDFGKVSYCLYVIHGGVYWMIFRFVLHRRFGEQLWLDLAVAPVAFLLSWALAQLSWKYFERPILLRARSAASRPLIIAAPEGQTQTA